MMILKEKFPMVIKKNVRSFKDVLCNELQKIL